MPDAKRNPMNTTTYGVAKIAKKYDKTVIAFAGAVTEDAV